MASVKFTDIVGDKYDGPGRGQDFASWLTTFELGCKCTDCSPKQRVQLLIAYLRGQCQDIALNFVADYEQENTIPPYNAAVSTVRLYYSEQYEALKAHLKEDHVIVGSSPELRLLDQWKNLIQAQSEKALTYYQRLVKLRRRLAEQDPPHVVSDIESYATFVTGLKRQLQLHVRTNDEEGG